MNKTCIAAAMLFLLAIPVPRVEGVEVKAQISEIRNQITEAENTKNLEKLAAGFTPDVVLYISDIPPVIGTEAVSSFYGFLFGKYDLTMEYQVEEVVLENDAAVERGLCINTTSPVGGGSAKTDTVSYRWDFRRQEDGSWRRSIIILGDRIQSESRMAQLPEPTGKFGVGRVDLLMLDTLRPETFTTDPDDRREVAVQVWYPARLEADRLPEKFGSPAANLALAKHLGLPLFFNSYYSLLDSHTYLDASPDNTNGPHPLLLYNHGYSGITNQHVTLFEDLVSHGYIVASIGHAYESSLFYLPAGQLKTFPLDNSELLIRQREAGGAPQEAAKDGIIRAKSSEERERFYRELFRLSPAHQESVRIWAEDNSFVLDQLKVMADEGEEWPGLIDFDRIGVMGHSLGGATAGQLTVVDSRIKAGINMDGFQFGDLIDSPLTVPFMFIAPERPWSGEHNNTNDLFSLRAKSKTYLVNITGFQHSSFSDLVLMGAAWEGPQAIAAGVRAVKIQRAITRAFFDNHLKIVDGQLTREMFSEFEGVHLRGNSGKPDGYEAEGA